jgi:Domain of unknown function (DUF5916)/Carbohydrate family 9 binding domain-like
VLTFAAFVALVLAESAATEPTAIPLPPRPHLVAVRTATPPKIDGRLDDVAWRAALPSGGFVQHYPDEGAPPSEHTEVRVLYDDRNLYVGVDCPQIHSPVIKRLQRRDGFLPSDGVWIDIDSRRDGVSAYHFSINAAGALLDGIHYNDTAFSADWDAIWEAKVADTDRGYSVEFRIPLSSLRFTLPVKDWGFQVSRAVDARQETDDWAFYPRRAANFVPYFGRLDNLTDLPTPRRLELRPFAVGRLENRAADADTGALEHGVLGGGSAGLDAKAHLTNQLTLDLTLNPDFGQVDADTVILNLSTFETFFPEKRPFFLEGLEVFATLRPILYTRRIGGQPVLPTLAGGESLVARPDPSRIYSAAKLSGTLGARTTVGVMSALTGQNDVEIQTPDGARVRRIVDPLTMFNVVRVKRPVAANADVGLLVTATNRFETATDAVSRCPVTQLPPAADGRCTNDAYVASVDGRWRSKSGDYAAAWQGIGSALARGPARAQPDGIPIEPGHVDGGAALYVGKEGGAHWLWNGWQYLSGRQLEFNDLGYLERKDDYQGYFNLTYRTLQPWRGTQETRSGVQLNLRETLDGINLWNELILNTWISLRSFWAIYFEIHGRGPYSDDREMGDGSALERSANLGAYAAVSTDPRRRVTGSLGTDLDRRQGGFHFDFTTTITLRLLPRLELNLIPTVSYDTGAPRYIGTDPSPIVVGSPPDYRFGTQTAASVGATLRASYTFTPELSLQFYTQLFLASVHYGPFFVFPKTAFRERVNLSELIPAGPPPTNPDSEQATLNVNVVLRWEYRLGSTLFLVYTRAQTPALSVPPLGRAGFELAPVWQGHAADDVVMLKLAYWLG